MLIILNGYKNLGVKLLWIIKVQKENCKIFYISKYDLLIMLEKVFFFFVSFSLLITGFR